ncbi:hypothetical protein ACKWTF_009455 [Chironomus riparius]
MMCCSGLMGTFQAIKRYCRFCGKKIVEFFYITQQIREVCSQNVTRLFGILSVFNINNSIWSCDIMRIAFACFGLRNLLKNSIVIFFIFYWMLGRGALMEFYKVQEFSNLPQNRTK